MNEEKNAKNLDEIHQKANDLMDEIVEIMAEAQESISQKSQELFTALGGCLGGKKRYPSI
jgi:SMC interacting uncharacterized protein involved in chromosome segregation